MTRPELVQQIARELLAGDMLNEADYNFDIKSLMKDVEAVISKGLADYIIISGSVLEN